MGSRFHFLIETPNSKSVWGLSLGSHFHFFKTRGVNESLPLSSNTLYLALSGHRSSYRTSGLFFHRSSDGISRIWGSFYKSREFDLRSSDGILFLGGVPRWSSSTTSTSPIKKLRFDEKAIRAFSNRPISKSGSSDGVVKLKVPRF